jgi:hypothetical protein
VSAVELGIIVGSLLAATGAFIYVALAVGSSGKSNKSNPQKDLIDGATRDVEHIFNEEFREELRNRGRLHFEKIIGENAMFLQQDLRLTTSELNEFMKKEITQKLTEEFERYQQSIDDAKELAVESITKTQTAIEQQRQMMGQQLAKEVSDEKTRLLKHFHENMGDIVNYYVLAAVGNQIDLNDQLEFIISELETNKNDILQDITNGA